MDGITGFDVDITTLAVARGIVQMMLGGLLLYLGSRHYDARDARWWAMGFFLNGISLFVFPFELPEAWEPTRTIINHLTLGSSAVFFLIGFWKFGHQRVNPWLLVLLMIFPIISLTAWEFLWPNARYRILCTAAGQVVYLLLLQHSLSRPPRVEIARIYARLRYVVITYTAIYVWSYANLTQILPIAELDTLDYHRSFFSVASLLYALTLAVGCLALQFALMAAHNADLALRDWLTSLLNRRGFFSAIQHNDEPEQTPKTPISLMALDIDHFKKINDQYGHTTGDQVLQQFSQMLKQVCGKDRIVARMGGEEFLVMMYQANQRDAAILAENIRKQTEKMTVLAVGGQQFNFTISIGIYEVLDNEAIEQALVKVDEALYAAKQNGRNQVASLSGSAVPQEQRHFRFEDRPIEI